MGGRKAWLVWGLAVAAYGAAVMQRSSLGVAGEQAAAHFGTTVAIVSTFAMIQLAAYAALQIPAGVLLDRFGARTMIAVGSAVMGSGQLMLAATDVLAVAFVARFLVGAGDAFLFGSALRLVPAWFAPKRVPILSQLTGMLGQVGQLAAVVAVLPMVRTWGWSTGIMVSASVSFVFAVISAVVIRNSPKPQVRPKDAPGITQLHHAVGQVLQHPGTRLGFWVHFTSGFFLNLFLVMWGMPYLTIAQGRDATQAGALFSVAVVGGIVFGPVIGHLTARYPMRRSNLALVVIIINLVLWTVVLAWPGASPTWLLFLLMVAISAAGPGTGIGFDYPRTFLPHTRLGAANGVVISGGFLGATLCLLVIAVVLQLLTGGAAATPQQLNLAMSAQLPFFAVGLLGIHFSRRQLARHMAADGVTVSSWRDLVARLRRRRRR